MDYKIIEKDSFKVVGKAIKLSSRGGEHHMKIAEFWQECNSDGTIEKIISIDKRQSMLGICMDFEDYSDQFTYMIAIHDTKDSSPAGFDTKEIPSVTLAVFTSVGPIPQAIADVWAQIFGEWFPQTGFEQADAPLIEVYPPGNTTAEDYKCEVWVPIMKK